MDYFDQFYFIIMQKDEQNAKTVTFYPLILNSKVFKC